MAQLTDGIQFLKGIGPAKAKLFEALGIHTIGDLLYHYPRTYEDRTRLAPIASLEVDQPACFRAMVMTSPRTSFIRKGLEITKVTVADHSARLNLTFFNQKHVAERLQYGREYIFYGAVSGDFIGYNMTNPAFEAPEEAPLVTRFVTVTPDNPRAMQADALKEILTPFGKPVTACPSVPQGVEEALRQAGPQGLVLAFGSLYMVGDVRKTVLGV